MRGAAGNEQGEDDARGGCEEGADFPDTLMERRGVHGRLRFADNGPSEEHDDREGGTLFTQGGRIGGKNRVCAREIAR
jgi:hypothetical protein